MTTPTDPHDADFRATLPVGLRSLDRELSGIRIEERPSFAPELERELLEAWKNRGESGARRPHRRWVRTLLAAGIAGLMIAGVSVPSARAAVGEFVLAVAREVFPDQFPPEPEPEVALPEIQVEEPPAAQPETRHPMVVSPADASDEAEASEPEFETLPNVEITFPEIVSRQEAARIIASHYPPDLQQEGVEGSVLLQFWVDEQGNAQNISLHEGSGNDRLDRAAMMAVREVQFRPATRNGISVGTWVEVQVHFFALTGAGIIGSDTMDSGDRTS